MTTDQALEFVRAHGVVLEAGSGPVPALATEIAGAPIRKSWWGHPMAHVIFEVTRAVRAAPDVLVCRLVGGKVTYVHRRLWPALVRLADRLGTDRLAALRQVHTATGRHRVEEFRFPTWVPSVVRRAASDMDEGEAASLLGDWLAEDTRRPATPARPQRPKR